MNWPSAAMCTIALLQLPTASQAQSPAKPEPPRPAATFDAASIRRQAAQLAEFRSLLADPDSTVRLLTMREAMRAGDATQRQLAIDAGLASNESAMMEQALRGIFSNIQQIVIEFTDADGKVTAEGSLASFRLTVSQFDPETGKTSGSSSCAFDMKWAGQLQGSVFSFDTNGHGCSGTLSWAADTGDFRGRVNTDNGAPKATRAAVWKPR